MIWPKNGPTGKDRTSVRHGSHGMGVEAQIYFDHSKVIITTKNKDGNQHLQRRPPPNFPGVLSLSMMQG